jgi:hypothetical protein
VDQVARLHEWIDAQLEAAQSDYEAGEEAREESGYTDLDALEQTVANEAVLCILADLRDFLEKNGAPRPTDTSS